MGLHLDAAQKDRDRDHQHPARKPPGAGLRSREVTTQQGSRRERSWRLLSFIGTRVPNRHENAGLEQIYCWNTGSVFPTTKV
jgi:hypothetical protein